MTSRLGKIIYSKEQIQKKIEEVAVEINKDYQGKELVIIGILKGSLYFVADLTRHLTIPINIDFSSIGLSSEAANKNAAIRFKKDLDLSISDVMSFWSKI